MCVEKGLYRRTLTLTLVSVGSGGYNSVRLCSVVVLVFFQIAIFFSSLLFYEIFIHVLLIFPGMMETLPIWIFKGLLNLRGDVTRFATFWIHVHYV